MSTITSKDGAEIYYKDWGTGPVVTFSHGWPLNADACSACVARRGALGRPLRRRTLHAPHRFGIGSETERQLCVPSNLLRVYTSSDFGSRWQD